MISGDTTPCEALRIAAHEADLLIHEATFADDEADRAAETGHSTAGQAAAIASDADVRMLALTHFSTRYPVGVLRDEARAIFARTVLPRDFDTIEIPFPERGEPVLVRWDETPHAAGIRRAPDRTTNRTIRRNRGRSRGMSVSSRDRVQTERLICERLDSITRRSC